MNRQGPDARAVMAQGMCARSTSCDHGRAATPAAAAPPARAAADAVSRVMDRRAKPVVSTNEGWNGNANAARLLHLPRLRATLSGPAAKPCRHGPFRLHGLRRDGASLVASP